jgi:hypothetical protein
VQGKQLAYLTDWKKKRSGAAERKVSILDCTLMQVRLRGFGKGK